MAVFRIYLIGTAAPIDVELPARDVRDLGEVASRVRFLVGHMAQPDGNGTYAAVLIPPTRIHLALEAD